MTSRRLALVCCSKGPWVSTIQIARPAVRVTGLKEGYARIHLRNLSDEVVETHDVACDGDHALPSAPWMRVELTHPSRKVICEIIATKRQVA